MHSPFTDTVRMPIQSIAAKGVAGWAELDLLYQSGLQDIAGFEYLILIYHLHLIECGSLTVTPFLDTQPRGFFATRSPKRPNPIGLSILRLMNVNGPRLNIEDVDVVDGTPLLDIKLYVPQFDVRMTERIGWFAGKVERVNDTRADDRFR
ncbi:MAG: tRNA (N6-threonylcarbamoyladenosine(37)-N6)-methyltransferase TrmO [Anaerolineales bacterium]